MKVFLCIILIFSFFSNSCNRNGKSTVFKKLDSKSTGIDFSNTLVESDSLNILDYLYFYNGAGVASGDFNNDGLEDLYFVSNQSSNKLYVNKGDLRFEDITESAGVKGTGSWKTGVTVVDINGDGFKDIYVSAVSGYKSFKGKNQLFINNGNLTFTESAAKWGIDFAGLSTQASFFDYDKDGDLDLFILTHSVHNNETYGDSTLRYKYNPVSGDHLFRNDGNTFVDVTRESGIYSAPIGYGLGISIADMNNDGWDDIYISNDFFEQDYYYVNQQNGTFKEKLKESFGHVSLFSMGNTLSDINKDGCLDVVTTDMLPDDVKALKTSINDEPLDIYNLEVRSGYYYQYSKNTLQLNVGNGGKFVDVGLYSGIAATDWTWSPLVQDFNMDGKKDIFFSNGIKKRLTDLDYLKYLSDPQIAKTVDNRYFDGEKIERMPDGKVHNFLYFSDSLLRFEEVSASNEMDIPSSSSGAIAVDLDNDGDLELVTNNTNEVAFIYKNTSLEKRKKEDPNFLIYSVTYEATNLDGIGTKFYMKSKKANDHQEIQTSNAFQSNQSNSLLFTFLPDDSPLELLVVWPNNSYQIINNFKAGTKHTINYDSTKVKNTTNVSLLITSFINENKQFDFLHIDAKPIAQVKTNPTPDFNYYSLLPHSYLPPTPAIAGADINKDSFEDIYVGGILGEEKYLLLGNKDGSYKKVSIEEFEKFKEYGDLKAEWVDIDADGDMDLIVQSSNHPYVDFDKIIQPRLYINKGNLKFEYKALPEMPTLTSSFYTADFNGDGLPEIFFCGAVSFRNYTKVLPSYLLVNNGKGLFSFAPETMLNGLNKIPYIQDVKISDLDKNGKPDIIIAAEWQPLHVFLNKGKHFERRSLPELDKIKGWWQSVTVADLDEDGKPDLVAGNWGVNNKFNVTSSSPLLAYDKDFDDNGRNDLILSYSHRGKYYPFRQKSDLDQEIPYLKKEWLSYQKMADKTTPEVFNVGHQEASLSANYFKSIFVSNVLDVAKIEELPYLFQQAPIRSISDRRDGKRDEFVINGNFWGVIPYEGKYDALGLVSIRYVDGKFSSPEYWINPVSNFQELTFVKSFRVGDKLRWLVLTYEGKLLVLSEKESDRSSD